MPKLPQVNIRLAPEHHDLIRQLAQRLRADPSLAVWLAYFLAQASESDPIQVSPLPHGLADEVADLKERLEENRDLTLALQERLMIQSEGLQRTTAYADSLNERVKALEERAETTTEPETAPPKPTPFRPRAFPAEDVKEAARLWDGGKGPSFSKIVAMKDWPHDPKGLNKAVRKYLQRNTERNTDFSST